MELRCHNCQRVWQYIGEEKLYIHCPQCNEVVSLANPSGSRDRSVLNQ
jgi:phage FluMu protein Com